MNRVSLREAFGKALVDLGERYDHFVVLDADVAGGTCTSLFRHRFPMRFFEFGVCEQNMMGAAAGFASCGITPIVTTYSVFASMRALEQARTSIAYPKLDVKICASHVGVDAGPDGATHQGIEDLALYRSIPNMTVVSPCDGHEVHAALEAILLHKGPVYMRTGRSPAPYVFTKQQRFKLGSSQVLKSGIDVALVATGVMTARALEAADLLAVEGIDAAVVNVSTLKPLDVETIATAAAGTGAIVTCEDHVIHGGLFSAVCEATARNCPVPIEPVGIHDSFGTSGEPEVLAEHYRLTAQWIVSAAQRVMEHKEQASETYRQTSAGDGLQPWHR